MGVGGWKKKGRRDGEIIGGPGRERKKWDASARMEWPEGIRLRRLSQRLEPGAPAALSRDPTIIIVGFRRWIRRVPLPALPTNMRRTTDHMRRRLRIDSDLGSIHQYGIK
jgi:hypothetical protein